MALSNAIIHFAEGKLAHCPKKHLKFYIEKVSPLKVSIITVIELKDAYLKENS